MWTFLMVLAGGLVLLVVLAVAALVIASEISKRREQNTLAAGRPVVTTLVMANNQLLEPDGVDAAPGVVVLSFDPPSRPLVEFMSAVGEKCFDLYTSDETLQLPPSLRDVALRMKADRYHSGRRTLIPPELAGPHRLYLADLWIVRKRFTGHFEADRVIACAATGIEEGRLVHLPPEDPRTAALLGTLDGIAVAGLAPFAPSPVGPQPLALAADAFAPRPAWTPSFPPPSSNAAPNSTRKVVWIIASIASAWLIGIVVLFAVLLYLGASSSNRRPRPIATKATPSFSPPSYSPQSDSLRRMLDQQRQREQQDRERRAQERAEQDALQEKRNRDFEASLQQQMQQAQQAARAQQEALRKADQDSRAELDRQMRAMTEPPRSRPFPTPPFPTPTIPNSPIPTPQVPSSPPPAANVEGTVVEALDASRPLSIKVSRPDVLTFGPSGSKVFVVENDVWDAESGERIRTLDVDVYQGGMRRAISADGRWLASGWTDRDAKSTVKISVQSLETGARSFETSLAQFESSFDLQVVRNTVLLATDRVRSEFPLFDLATGEQKKVIKREAAKLSVTPVFSPDGTRYVQAQDESLVIRATRTGEIIATLDKPPVKLAEQPEQGQLQREIFNKVHTSLLMSTLRAVSFSPDGRELAAVVVSSTRMPRIVCWDEAGRIVFDLDLPELQGRRSLHEPPGWLPDARGWVAQGAVIDRKSKRIVLLFMHNPRTPSLVHPVDSERMLVLTPTSGMSLRAYRIPWPRIQSALDNPASEKLPLIAP